MNILNIEHVSIAYDREKDFAVEDVSLQVDQGEYVCLIGSNGSGKSTLLKGIVGLAPVTKGHITLNIPPDKYAYMGQVNQIEKNFPATVWEVVLSGTQKQGSGIPFYKSKDKEIARWAMETFEVESMAGKRIGHLSGGQQQRVLLARAFCRNPQLLILDEPCAGLDPEITADFYQLLGKLNEEKDVTIVMASHDMGQVATSATRIIVMNRTKEFDGSNSEWVRRNQQ